MLSPTKYKLKRFLWRLLFSFVFGCLLVLATLFLSEEISWDQFKNTIWNILSALIRAWQFWVFIMLLMGMVEAIAYFVNVYKNGGIVRLVYRFTGLVIAPVVVLMVLFNLSQSYVNGEDYEYTWNHTVENISECASSAYENDYKQRGIHVFGKIDDLTLRPLIQNNIEWITLAPFIGQNHVEGSLNNLSLDPRQRNKDSILIEKITLAHNRGLSVFLKPHIWLSEGDGKWRSDIFPKNDNVWKSWSANYQEHLLHFAKIAEQNGVELLCVGTELARLSTQKPDFWKQLIAKIRTVYSGQLTYAANWDQEYDIISFWEDLDFIGIQAYFPLVGNGNTNLKDMENGWKKYSKNIKTVSQKFDKPVIFTELGYKSTEDAAARPWRWVTIYDRLFTKVSFKTQAIAYKAFFNTIWKEDWFYGVHIWKWQAKASNGIFEKNHDFTPQNKPAQNIIAAGFATKTEK